MTKEASAPPHKVVGSPYLEINRADWARLRDRVPMSLTEADLSRIQGAGVSLDLAEVEDVYLPLSRLLTYYVEAVGGLHQVTAQFLKTSPSPTPFVIGVAGSVAVGKSTTARLLRDLMRRWPTTPKVDLITTDGFLLPNAELEKRGIMHRKGFPESYDRRALLRFVADVKSGVPQVTAPVYSHLEYDIIPGERITVDRPDVLIVEGLNVLQSPLVRKDGRLGLAVSDFFDFSLYVDAREDDIKRWFTERFLGLRETAFADPDSFFQRFAGLSDAEAIATASDIWDSINGPNLHDNVEPTRGRATCILVKSPDHSVERVLLRKL